MPEGFELVIWGVVIALLWLRGLTATAKRKREQEQASVEGSAAELGIETQRPAAGQRRSIRDQWRDMAGQIELQMQQAQAEGRPGSLVAHVDDDEEDDPQTLVIPGRRVLSDRTPRPSAVPALRSSSSPTIRRPPPVVTSRRPPPVVTTRRESAPGDAPLDRLDRYPPLARAIILSEILGPPPGLVEDRWEEEGNSP